MKKGIEESYKVEIASFQYDSKEEYRKHREILKEQGWHEETCLVTGLAENERYYRRELERHYIDNLDGKRG